MIAFLWIGESVRGKTGSPEQADPNERIRNGRNRNKQTRALRVGSPSG
jgi:hypothetical protein